MAEVKHYGVFQFKDGIIHADLTGQFPVEVIKARENVFKPLADACAAHNCRKALVDATGLEVELGFTDMFKAAKDLASLMKHSIHVAFLAREDMLDPFFTDVARNRGSVMAVFTDADAAAEWLAQWPD